MKRITALTSGEKARIVKLEGTERFITRAISVGLTIGNPVEMIQNEKKMPLLLFSRDSTIALNHKECEGIYVEGNHA